MGIVPAIAVKSFPAAIRFSGLSFSYNIAYAIFGGLTPMIITTLIIDNVMAPAYYVAVVSLVGVLASLAIMRFRPTLDLAANPA
ncbi:hypothetical protein LDJ79_07150 [Vibrio tritonius]|uniref:Major facilitator superfamily (MFS) profile domain-containing protein n=1 Tax=Vibrio tritonius TaxID=1435069 RepID=A0ABS7YLD4_9VIBR|nr:hypothetical protein [Vibrio tritonius]MCA2015882.1 hypothetical protein [Vibrio tritonius]